VGLRLLWRDRAFSITVGLTLALCLGANVALFSVVNNVLLRPLPIPESDRLVIVSNAYPNAGAGGSFRLMARILVVVARLPRLSSKKPRSGHAIRTTCRRCRRVRVAAVPTAST